MNLILLPQTISYHQILLKFTDINKRLFERFMFKVFNDFNTFLNQSYITRGQFLLRPKIQRTTVTQRSIANCWLKTWDSPSDSIKIIRTLPLF